MNILRKLKMILNRTKASKDDMSYGNIIQNYNTNDDNIEFVYQSFYSPINDINCALLNIRSNDTGDTVLWNGYPDTEFRKRLDDVKLDQYVNRNGNFSTNVVKSSGGKIYNLYRINIDIITGKKDYYKFVSSIRALLPDVRCIQYEKKNTRNIFTFSIGLKDAAQFIYNLYDPTKFNINTLNDTFILSFAKFLNNIMKNIDNKLSGWGYLPPSIKERYIHNLPEIVNYLGKFDEGTYFGFENTDITYLDLNCKKYFPDRYVSGKGSNFNVKDCIRSRFILLGIDNTLSNLIDKENRLVTIIERDFDRYSYINPIIDSYYENDGYNLGLSKPGNNVTYTLNESYIPDLDEMHKYTQWSKNGYFYDFVFQIPIRVFNQIYERYTNHGNNLDDTSGDLSFIKDCIDGKFDND